MTLWIPSNTDSKHNEFIGILEEVLCNVLNLRSASKQDMYAVCSHKLPAELMDSSFLITPIYRKYVQIIFSFDTVVLHFWQNELVLLLHK